MNKTISISISGFAFIIDETAYQRLQKYLATIRGYFTSADGVDEIMTDIEIRIAELFRERLNDNRQVIDESDVEYVISILGQPEAFIDEGAEEMHHTTPKTGRRSRRIFRDPDNKSVAGVASGIAAYFGTDPVWIRLVFVLLTLGGLAGIPIYIILWVIMPEAKTAADKLEMRGEPVTAENIGRKVSESFERVKKNVGGIANPDEATEFGRRARTGVEEVFILIGKAMLLLLKAIVKIVGVLFIIIAVILFIAFTMAVLGIENANILQIDGHSYPMSDVYKFSQLVISPENIGWWFTAAFYITFGIPLIALLYSGFRLLFGMKHKIKGLGIGLFILWFIGFCTLLTVGFKTASEFADKQNNFEITSLSELQQDTLYLKVLPDPHFPQQYLPDSRIPVFEMSKIEGEMVYMGYPKVNVVENVQDTIFEIAVFRYARGVNSTAAIARAENIEYNFELSENQVAFQPYFSFPTNDRFRSQSIYVEVRVPAGKSVHFSENLDRVIYDVKNTTNTYDRDMVGSTWTMLTEGLTCLGCDPGKIKSKKRKSY